MPLKDEHKTHLGNFALFVVLMGLLVLPFAGIEFVRFEEGSEVLSEQDFYFDTGVDTSLPSQGEFVKYEGDFVSEDLEDNENPVDEEYEEDKELSDSEEFDPVSYPPANLVPSK